MIKRIRFGEKRWERRYESGTVKTTQPKAIDTLPHSLRLHCPLQYRQYPWKNPLKKKS